MQAHWSIALPRVAVCLAGCAGSPDGAKPGADAGDSGAPEDSSAPEHSGTPEDSGAPEDTGGPDIPDGYIPGESIFGNRDFIEYIPGELPIILVAPHGGYLEPEDLPTIDTHGRDNNTQETTRETAAWLELLTGKGPHIIINRLYCDKLNAARDIDEAAGEHPDARLAWEEFHGFIEVAKAEITEVWGAGHYVDEHANGHTEGWNEVGLGVSPALLNGDDAGIIERCAGSTVASLCGPGGVDMLELVRGETSLGGLLMDHGYLSVPSPEVPAPGEGGFFYAGWNTWEHGSKYGGTIDATHMENHWTFMVDDEREAYTLASATALIDFMAAHYGFEL